MKDHYEIIKGYLKELDYHISSENKADGIMMIQNEKEGVENLIIGIADPILIMEQYVFRINHSSESILTQILQKNRDIVHGAFVLDETGKSVIFRDTLQLENLDLNELEGSINSLCLLLSEYMDQIIEFSKY